MSDEHRIAQRGWAIKDGETCSVHGGIEMETYCDGWVGYCTAYDGTRNEAGFPTCRFPELEKPYREAK